MGLQVERQRCRRSGRRLRIRHDGHCHLQVRHGTWHRDGSDDINFKFNISVPAGGTVTLMSFVVMTGTDTGLTATDTTARATQVDTQAADIANNFRTNFAYQRGMTQGQLDTLKNF